MATRNFRARHQQDHKRRRRKNFFTSDSYSDSNLKSPFPKIKFEPFQIFAYQNGSKSIIEVVITSKFDQNLIGQF